MTSLTMQQSLKKAMAVMLSFRSYEAFPENYRDEVYDILVNKFEVEVGKSILISWLPEGGKNIGVNLIDQKGQVCFFDIDPDYPENDTVERMLVTEYEKSNYFKKLKPWHELVLGVKLYREQKKPDANCTSNT